MLAGARYEERQEGGQCELRNMLPSSSVLSSLGINPRKGSADTYRNEAKGRPLVSHTTICSRTLAGASQYRYIRACTWCFLFSLLLFPRPQNSCFGDGETIFTARRPLFLHARSRRRRAFPVVLCYKYGLSSVFALCFYSVVCRYRPPSSYFLPRSERSEGARAF